jgi:outer membrane protein TolC
VSEKRPTHLPIFDDPPESDEPSCSPKVYVSNEEKAILEAMRGLREQAVELRGRLKNAETRDDRDRIEAELAELRARRADLAARREQAYRRKMIMLGHLPPDDEIRLF